MTLTLFVHDSHSSTELCNKLKLGECSGEDRTQISCKERYVLVPRRPEPIPPSFFNIHSKLYSIAICHSSMSYRLLPLGNKKRTSDKNIGGIHHLYPFIQSTPCQCSDSIIREYIQTLVPLFILNTDLSKQ
jgi:hypothetical protein